jgi:hypothetical protein
MLISLRGMPADSIRRTASAASWYRSNKAVMVRFMKQFLRRKGSLRLPAR